MFFLPYVWGNWSMERLGDLSQVMEVVSSEARTWPQIIQLQSPPSVTALCVWVGLGVPRSGSHSDSRKLYSRDGIKAVLGDQTAEDLSPSLAVLKEPDSLTVLGPDASPPVGYPHGAGFQWVWLFLEDALGLHRSAKWLIGLGRLCSLGVLRKAPERSWWLCLLPFLTPPDHRASSPGRKAEQVELCCDMMDPNRDAALLGSPAKVEFPGTGSHGHGIPSWGWTFVGV